MGVVSLRGAPLSLLTFATAQFKRFFDCGRAVRCMLPLGSGRFLHLVVLFGFQGDREAEKLALTDKLLDAAFGELVWLLENNHAWLLATSTWSPPKSLAWQKGSRLGSGLTLKLLGLLLVVCSLVLLASVLGLLVVVTGGTSWWVVPLLLLRFYLARSSLTGGLLLILLSGPYLTAVDGPVVLLSRFSVLLFGLLLGYLLWIRVGGLSRLRFRGFGRSMMTVCSVWPGLRRCWIC